jgi:TonB family protein
MVYARFMLSLLVVAMASYSGIAQQPSDVLPKIVQHAEPMYPPLARQTRIQGDVRIEFSTNGESVTDVVVESGHPLLRAAAEENVRTWKFASHTPGKFQVIFRYKLADGGAEVAFPESPSMVQIAASVPIVSEGPCGTTLEIGTWKTQLNSSHGVTSQVLELSEYCADSLEGTARGPKGRKEKIEFGYYDEPFLAFTMNVTQPDGRKIKTFFVGKISKYKIVGTFVDEAGTTGQWTGVRMAETPSSR